MRGESASSTTYSETSERAVNTRNRYVDHLKDISKPTWPIHGPGHSSDECKVLGDFGSNYSKSRHTKDRGHDTATNNEFNIQQENNSIVNYSVEEIILKENKKSSTEDWAHGNIDYEIDKNNQYEIDNMSLDENKENTEWRRRKFERDIENTYDI